MTLNSFGFHDQAYADAIQLRVVRAADIPITGFAPVKQRSHTAPTNG